MKKNIFFNILIILGLLINSCELTELDNYDSPDSTFQGSIIDKDTGEPIPQALINGSEIEYIELGYENPQIQYLRFKTDGSFKNKLMFAGTYVAQAVRGNFFEVEPDTIEIKGKTEYTFETRPYIRINDVNIELNADESKVVATFKLDQESGNPVKSIMLAADHNSNVCRHISKSLVVAPVNSVVDPQTEFTLEMEISTLLEKEYKNVDFYHFRIGALIDGIPEAKYNYSDPVRLEID